MRSARAFGWSTSVVVLVGGLACASPAADPPPGEGPLTYRYRRQFAGLDEVVTIVKTPRRAYGLRADGRSQPLAALRREDRLAWVERHGKLSPALVARLHGARSEDVLPVFLAFDAGISWRDTRARLTSADAELRRASRGALHAAIQQRAAELAPGWEQAGFRVTALGQGVPLAFGEATPDVIRKLGRLPDVKVVLSNEPGIALSDAGPPSSMTDPFIKEAFNDLGFFGEGQRIGSAELPRCSLFHEHEAFSQSAGVQYSHPVPTCDVGSPTTCEIDCSSQFAQVFSGTVECVQRGPIANQGECMATHTSQVGSCMLSTKEGSPWGAARAELFHYNGPLARCEPAGMDDAYAWFDENDVTTVAQSWSCRSAPDRDGLVQDHYARASGISVFKSAGNQQSSDVEEACSSTLNSVCVGAAEPFGTAMATTSSFVNPAGPMGSVGDREEPDLVALGVGVDTLDPAATNAWTTADGTSFATPAVTALAALLKQACGQELARNPLAIRAILQNAAFMRNPDGYRYSTPSDAADHKDGAGGVVATQAMVHCGSALPGAPSVAWDSFEIDLTQGEELPAGETHDPDQPPPGEAMSLRPASYDAPGPADGRLAQELFDFGALPQGTRVRATFVWNSCPPTQYVGPFVEPPSEVATDFDLFLYDSANEAYVYGSQSVDDNSEGFDIAVPESGRFVLYVAWPKDSEGCESVVEPIAIAVTAGHP